MWSSSKKEEIIKVPCKVSTREIAAELFWTWTCGLCGYTWDAWTRSRIRQKANEHWKEAKHTGTRQKYPHIGPSLGTFR